jgi:hypothetical protein
MGIFRPERNAEVFAERSQLEVSRRRQSFVFVKQPHGPLHGTEQTEMAWEELPHALKPRLQKWAIESSVVRDELGDLISPPRPCDFDGRMPPEKVSERGCHFTGRSSCVLKFCAASGNP